MSIYRTGITNGQMRAVLLKRKSYGDNLICCYGTCSTIHHCL